MRLAVLLLVLFAAPAALGAITIETVPIGNPGNADDLQGFATDGAVDYEFDLGKYEVTNAQYVAFLNAVDATGANLRGLYNASMTTDSRGGINFSSFAANGSKYAIKSGRADNPVVFVSFFDAARFTNWLHNGQGSANTEDGAYLLTGGTPIPTNGDFVSRKPSASWCLPTFDEWYKAAYHKNDGATGNYWDYPTASDATPFSDQPPGTGAPSPARTANFFQDDALANGYNDGYAVTGATTQVAATNYLANVGAYTLAHGPYGTFDQGGNVWEWTGDSPSLESRRVAGGSWINTVGFLSSATNNATNASTEANTVGFRVAKIVPFIVPGDYNTDGFVNAADYTVWRDTLGSHSDLRANGDNSAASAGVIDQADYNFWKANFGQPAGAASIAAHSVPEPASIIILIVATLALVLLPSSPILRWRLSARFARPLQGPNHFQPCHARPAAVS